MLQLLRTTVLAGIGRYLTSFTSQLNVTAVSPSIKYMECVNFSPAVPNIYPMHSPNISEPEKENPILPVEFRNDIQNRRRKMKKHKKRKWRRTHANLIRKLELYREQKEEAKLQELFEFWRKRSEAWDPNIKTENRLHFARRSGFYVDILNTPGSPLYNK